MMKAQAMSLCEDAPGCAAAERADLDPVPPRRIDHGVEEGLGAGPPGEEEGDVLLPEAAGGEGESVGGGPVEPLDVVDRDHERLAGRQRPQGVEQTERDLERAAPAESPGSARRSATSSALRCGATSQTLVRMVGEEVA
jgi:hypothetical protein